MTLPNRLRGWIRWLLGIRSPSLDAIKAGEEGRETLERVLRGGKCVAYRIVRTVAETVRGVELPVGLVASGTAPRVCDVAALVEVLFGEWWAVN